MTTVNKNFKVKNGLQVDPLTTAGFLINDASGIVSSTPAITDIQTYVKNNSGSTMYKGQPVYISSATGSNALISLSSSSSESTSSKTLGLLAQDLTTGSSGYVITNGTLVGVDTSAYTEGTALWLGSTAGTLSSTKAVAPNHLVYIGVVTRSHAINGEILIKVQNGFELDELHSVLITTPSNNDVLKYDSASGLWINGAGGGGSGSGTVTSVSLTTPTGLSISGSPITSSGTLALSLTSGYSIPTTTSQTNWDTAYGWGNHASSGYALLTATQTFTGTQTITTGADTNKGLIVKSNSGTQSANLQEWQNSSGTSLAKIDLSGNATAASFVKTGGTSSQFLKADGSVDGSTYITGSSPTITTPVIDSISASSTSVNTSLYTGPGTGTTSIGFNSGSITFAGTGGLTAKGITITSATTTGAIDSGNTNANVMITPTGTLAVGTAAATITIGSSTTAVTTGNITATSFINSQGAQLFTDYQALTMSYR